MVSAHNELLRLGRRVGPQFHICLCLLMQVWGLEDHQIKGFWLQH